MDLPKLEACLAEFCEAHFAANSITVSNVRNMPGHAGFSYGFDVDADGDFTRWYIRVPPPNVNWRGTADVLRQVEVLNALENTDVPHMSVRWSGDDLKWFGCPYFITPFATGDTLQLAEGSWGADLSHEQEGLLGRQVMTALAEVHRIDTASVPYLGEPVPFDEDVRRWDRFFERAADPHSLSKAPECRRLLLEKLPKDAPIGVFHGDFQTSNIFCSHDGNLKAIIDWELTGIGATLNDVGWICTFSDPDAWAPDRSTGRLFLDPDTLCRYYTEACGTDLPDLGWFRALAAYKFAIITGFNLSLHRRGKREDATWEVTALSMPPLIDRAIELLS